MTRRTRDGNVIRPQVPAWEPPAGMDEADRILIVELGWSPEKVAELRAWVRDLVRSKLVKRGPPEPPDAA